MMLLACFGGLALYGDPRDQVMARWWVLMAADMDPMGREQR